MKAISSSWIILVLTVMTTAPAVVAPAAVSTVTPEPPHLIPVTGVLNSTGIPWAWRATQRSVAIAHRPVLVGIAIGSIVGR